MDKRAGMILLALVLLSGCWSAAHRDQQRIKTEMGDNQLHCADGDQTACVSYFADRVIAEQCTNWQVMQRNPGSVQAEYDPYGALFISAGYALGYYSMIDDKCEGETRKMVNTFISCQNGNNVSCMDLAADRVAQRNAAQIQSLQNQWAQVQAMRARP